MFFFNNCCTFNYFLHFIKTLFSTLLFPYPFFNKLQQEPITIIATFFVTLNKFSLLRFCNLPRGRHYSFLAYPRLWLFQDSKISLFCANKFLLLLHTLFGYGSPRNDNNFSFGEEDAKIRQQFLIGEWSQKTWVNQKYV